MQPIYTLSFREWALYHKGIDIKKLDAEDEILKVLRRAYIECLLEN